MTQGDVLGPGVLLVLLGPGVLLVAALLLRRPAGSPRLRSAPMERVFTFSVNAHT
jgi:hypothetical protein